MKQRSIHSFFNRAALAAALVFSCGVIASYYYYHRLTPVRLWRGFYWLLSDPPPEPGRFLWLGARLGVQLLLFLTLSYLAYCIGKRLLRIFRLAPLGGTLETTLSLGLGLLTLSLGAMFLAALGLLYTWLLRLLVIFGLVFFLLYPPFSTERFSAHLKEIAKRRLSLLNLFCIFASCGFLLLGLLGCLLPVWWLDDQLTHIGLPRLFLAKAALVERPFAIASDHFLGLEMINTICLALGGDVFVKAFASLGALTLFAAFAAYAEKYDCWRGWLPACALYCAMPVVGFVSLVGAVAHYQAFFVLASLLALLCALERRGGQAPWLILAGLFFGGAVSLKMDSVLWLPILILVYLWGLSKAGRGREASWPGLASGVKLLGAFCLAAAIPVVPWLIKNWYFVGNPVFPLFHEWFSSSVISTERVSIWLGDVEKYGISYTPWWKALRLPWDLSVDRLNSFNSFSAGPLLLALLPLAFWRKPAFPLACLLAAGGLYLIPWGLTAQQSRYLLPALGLLCLGCGCLLGGAAEKQRRVLAVLMAVGLSASFLSLVQLRLANYGFFSYLLGQRSDAVFLASVSAPYPMIDFINEATEEDARILFIGEDEVYHCQREVLWEKFWQKAAITHILESAGKGRLSDELRRRGITHLAVNFRKFANWRKRFHKYAWTPEQEAELNSLLANGSQVVFRAKELAVYRLP